MADTKNINLSQYKNNLTDFENVSDEEIESFKQFLVILFKEKFNIDLSEIKIAVRYVNKQYELRIIIDDSNSYSVYITEEWLISIIYKISPIDIETYENKCQLQAFPAILESDDEKYELSYTDNVLQCSGKPVEIINLYSEAFICYDPFHTYEDSTQNDKWIRMPHYDRNGLLAFVGNRYAWGMNVAASCFCPKNNTVYYYGSQNFDYPEGIALRKVETDPNKLEIFLNNDDCDKTILYKDETQEFPINLDTIYDDSDWYDLHISRKYNDLYEWLGFIQSSICPNNLQIKEVNNYIVNLIKDKKYPEVIELGKLVLKCPTFNKLKGGVWRRCMDEPIHIKYNLACCYSLMGNIEEALLYLNEIKDDYKNGEYMATDTDLANLWDLSEFKEIVKYMEK